MTGLPPDARFIVSPDLPRMTISEGCPISPGFREEMNAWLLEFFGTHNLIADGQVIVLAGRQCYVNPRTHARIKDLI
jgi:hypothetical protein